jgi:hypothetical protein
MDIKKTDLFLIIGGPIILAPIANGYGYLGLVALYGIITGYFRYVRN